MDIDDIKFKVKETKQGLIKKSNNTFICLLTYDTLNIK